LFGRCAGGDVEVFRIKVQQQVADATADQISLITGILQAFHHADGVAADFSTLNWMLAAVQYFRRTVAGFAAAQRGTKGFEQLFQHERHCLTD
jgi:hypothetical protein